MDRRLEGLLHRWLPAFAGVAIGVAGITHWLKEDAVEKMMEEERQRVASEEPAKPPDPALVEAGAGATLEQVARMVTRLDSDVGTQRALAEAFAQNDTLQRLWVVDERGYIAYYAKEQPAARTVEVLASREVHALLETLPAGLLRSDQRLAILTTAAIREGLPSQEYGMDEARNRFSKMGIRPPPWLQKNAERLHTRLLPIKGGLIAVAAQTPSFSVPSLLGEEVYRLKRSYGRTIGISLLFYWLSIPLWVVLDALRHRERAIVWGLFTLIGNVVALLIYLLVRSRNGEQATG
jgi:hypothetical protein